MSTTSNTTHERFHLPGLEVAPGHTATGYCQVDTGAATLSVPIAVVHGTQPGPVLAVTAGIHGGEYVPILAARRFYQELNPETMTGTVVVSLQSSPLSFRDRVAFTNPLDGQNLNRSFPGDSAGGPTDQLAHWLWTHVISRADFYVDCHCGDLPEALQPFAGIVRTGKRDLDHISLAMANCWNVERTIAMGTGGSTISAAAAAEIPAVLIEIGDRGLWTHDEVDRQLDGLLAVAAQAGITHDHAARSNQERPVFEVSTGIQAQHNGLWFPHVQPGDQVEENDPIGTIEDPFGSPIETVASPTKGVYVYGLASLGVHTGDFLACIVRPTETD